MAASFFTALCFALSALFATRTSRLVGSAAANFSRQWLAFAFLALWAHGWGAGLKGQGLTTYFWSGVVGFGFGDLALFAALPLLGSRLTALIVQCLAAPFAAAIEWLWLGTSLSPAQLACGGVILLGVMIAVAPERWPRAALPMPVGEARGLGFILGILAAIGQGGGAVLSRKAHLLSAAGGVSLDGGTAAYQRLYGGIAVVSTAYLFTSWRAHRSSSAKPAPQWRTAAPWIVANGFAGPVIGVSCYQWALATTPSALVLPIVALTPLAVIPFAWFMENERPSARSLLGGALAVAAAATLAVFS